MKFSGPKSGSLLKFHRPKNATNDDTNSLISLNAESRKCLKNLANYTVPKSNLRFPKSRSAAVLVALFVGRTGDLYVLLSRRASTMRSYAGDTSLPGGKWEHGDRSLEYTARREAFEEIGLPMDRRKVPFLCALEPFLAGNQLIVTPIVVLVLDKTIRPLLNASEVHSLFSHPLISFLRSEPPFPLEPDTLEFKYHTFMDIKWQGHVNKVRMHRFLTGREAGGTKPIFGLTAAILIRVATIGYALAPEYELEAQGQPTHAERIEYALKHHPVFREASVKEGLVKPDKLQDCRVLPVTQADGDTTTVNSMPGSPSSSRDLSQTQTQLNPPQKMESPRSGRDRPQKKTWPQSPSRDVEEDRRRTLRGKVRSRL